MLVKFELLGVAIQMGKECNNHIGYAEWHRLDWTLDWRGHHAGKQRWTSVRKCIGCDGFQQKVSSKFVQGCTDGKRILCKLIRLPLVDSDPLVVFKFKFGLHRVSFQNMFQCSSSMMSSS